MIFLLKGTRFVLSLRKLSGDTQIMSRLVSVGNSAGEEALQYTSGSQCRNYGSAEKHRVGGGGVRVDEDHRTSVLLA